MTELLDTGKEWHDVNHADGGVTRPGKTDYIAKKLRYFLQIMIL